MKKTLSKFISYVSKNYFTIVLIIAIISLLSYSINLKSNLDKYTIPKKIKGTFASSDPSMPNLDTQYITFMNGEFHRYIQFELLDKGDYVNIYDNVYLLKSDNIDECIVYVNDDFYFYDREQDEIYKFFKINNVPTFINLKLDEN